MAEIDIDKMLEKSEKLEKEQKQRSLIIAVAIGAAGAVLAAIIIIAVTMTVLGEKSEVYFPLTPKTKYVYNKKGKSPEEWQVLDKKASLYGYDCSVLNRLDKGNYMSVQEYYCVDKKQGLAKLAYSENYGNKVKDVFVIMPYRIKKGKEFNAGMIKGVVVKGTVVDKENLSTPVGDEDAYRVEYKGLPYYDETVWYAAEIGVVREKNNLTGDELGLISAGE